MKTLVAIILITGIGVSFSNTIKQAPHYSIQKRKSIERLSNEEGVVYQCGNNDEPYYVIRMNKKHLTLLPGNIPAKFKKDQLQVVFSGELKEMNVLEDDAGQYFWLNSIITKK